MNDILEEEVGKVFENVSWNNNYENYMSQVVQAVKTSAEVVAHFQNLSKLTELASHFKESEENV